MPKEYEYKHLEDHSYGVRCGFPLDAPLPDLKMDCDMVFTTPEYGLTSCPECGRDIRRVWQLLGFSI